MEQLIKGKTDKGKFYVRPISWAGIWDADGDLHYGNTLFEANTEVECDAFIAGFRAGRVEGA